MKTETVLIVVTIGLGVLLMAGNANAGGERPKIEPRPGPGGKGTIWTTPKGGGRPGSGETPGNGGVPSGVPADFDYGGNGLYISPTCDYVIEGNLFWNESRAEEAPSLSETLAIARDNSVIGFIDYLTETEGLTTPQDVAWRILQEASPFCATLDPNDPSHWGDGLAGWFDNLIERITIYLDSFLDFGPEGEE